MRRTFVRLRAMIFRRFLYAALLLAGAALCVRLGLWQLARLEQRRDANRRVLAARNGPTLDITEGTAAAAQAVGRRVRARGRFDPSRPVLLRNRSWQGSPGVELKYYRTVREEFTSTRPAFRWRQLVALARVTASECGRPAPGVAQAKELLRV